MVLGEFHYNRPSQTMSHQVKGLPVLLTLNNFVDQFRLLIQMIRCTETAVPKSGPVDCDHPEIFQQIGIGQIPFVCAPATRRTMNEKQCWRFIASRLYVMQDNTINFKLAE